MRRRTSIADRILEHWASWRITEELYTGTGPSAIVRFREPVGTRYAGSRSLYMGICNRKLASLNADLFLTLGYKNTGVLLMLYGMPGDDRYKIRYCNLRPAAVNPLKSRARVVALRHISHTVKLFSQSNETY